MMLNYIKLLPNKVKRNVRSSANLGQHYRSSESTMFYQNQIKNNNNIIIIMNNSLLREHILIGICIYYTFIIIRIIIYRTAWMVVVVSNVLNCYEHAPWSGLKTAFTNSYNFVSIKYLGTEDFWNLQIAGCSKIPRFFLWVQLKQIQLSKG